MGKPCFSLSRTLSVRAVEKLKSSTSHSVSGFTIRTHGECTSMELVLAFAPGPTLGASTVRLAAHADPSTGSSRFIAFRRCQVRDRPSGKGKSKPFYRFDTPRKNAETMELEWAGFYRKAAQSARDSSIRELLDRLADAKTNTGVLPQARRNILTKPARARDDETSRRLFVQRLFGSPGPRLRSRTEDSRN